MTNRTIGIMSYDDIKQNLTERNDTWSYFWLMEPGSYYFYMDPDYEGPLSWRGLFHDWSFWTWIDGQWLMVGGML